MTASFQPSLFTGLLVILGCLSTPWGLNATELKYQYRDGDRLWFEAQSEQRVEVNGIRLQTNTSTVQIHQKVSIEGSGLARIEVQTDFTTLSKGAHSASQSSQSTASEFLLDELGRYTVNPESLVPVVRSIPTFAGHPVVPYQTWSAPATQVLNLSQIAVFAQNKQALPPITLSFPVSYRYVGQEQRDETLLDLIEIEYSVFYRPSWTKDQFRIYPTLISGTTRQRLAFDNARGLVDSYTEVDTLNLVLSNGDLYEFVETRTQNLVRVEIAERPRLVEGPVPEVVSTDVLTVTESSETSETTKTMDAEPVLLDETSENEAASPPTPDLVATQGSDDEAAVALMEESELMAEPVTEPVVEPVVETQPVFVRMPRETLPVTTVYFLPDSDQLTEEERAKLRSLVDLFSQHPGREVLIEGFTALAGTETQQRNLSRARALRVADYLIEIGVLSLDNVTFRGLGATRPLAENDVEEHRKQNRRVEITLILQD